MKLYSHIERVEKELEHIGYFGNSPIKQEILSPLDSMHYNGDTAIQAALDVLDLSSFDKEPAKILDVGSGFGGPARYMASRGCQVTALELQKDVHEKGLELSSRCNLFSEEKVMHVCGNI